MKCVAVIALLSVAWATSGLAATSSAQLQRVKVDAKIDAALPLSLTFTDDAGSTRTLGDAIGDTPALLVFADYTCTNLCGPILAFAAAGLERSGLIPGRDFHLVAIGLDPRDELKEARALKASRIDSNSPVADATALLIGDGDAIRAVTQAAGYHYVYDAEHDQFAHPAAAYVLTRDGRIARVLSGLGLDGGDLRLALVDAGHGRVGTLADQITLRCFGFDPARGIFTPLISQWLTLAGAGTMALLMGGIAWMTFGVRRRVRS